MPSLESPGANERRELPFREEKRGFSVTLKRNCSISPASLACVFAALGIAVLAIGAGFALVGAWLILPFAGLEVLLLAGAFPLPAAHATDYDRTGLLGDRLRIDVADGERVSRYEIDARHARLAMDQGALVLRGPRERVGVRRPPDAQGRAAP